jgi:hypothetical protein
VDGWTAEAASETEIASTANSVLSTGSDVVWAVTGSIEDTPNNNKTARAKAMTLTDIFPPAKS